MPDLVEELQDWVFEIRDDIEAIKTVLESHTTHPLARKYAAGALNYLVARMDLVPDWNRTIGVLDDVLVLRVCMQLARIHDPLDHTTDTDSMVRLNRMLSDTERIEIFLGKELYAKLYKYCSRLSEDEIRARTPDSVIADENTRDDLYAAVHDELTRMPAPQFDNPDDVNVLFKSYLHHKLASV